MKIARPILFALLVFLPCYLRAQSFVNLGFESAVIVTNSSLGYPFIVASSAIPGWTAYIGGETLSSIDVTSLFRAS